jgi:ABC-type Fe3+-hydroxamate transport system substrate-binding protein
MHEPPELAVPPQRVVSLVPSVTESLFDLNLGQRLVGRTTFCVRPEGRVETIPTVGETKSPDVQKIIDLAPELVIANHEENRQEDVEALHAAGITVWVTHPVTVDDVFTLLWDLMNVFDETSMVPRVRLIEYQYDWVRGLTAEASDLPSVFVPIWYNPLMTVGGDTYVHHLLALCGAHNVFGDRQRYPEVTFDDVVSAQPEIILLPSEPFVFTEAHLPEFKQLDVPAAENDQIFLVDGSLLTWHGTRIAYALEALPQLLKKVG